MFFLAQDLTWSIENSEILEEVKKHSEFQSDQKSTFDHLEHCFCCYRLVEVPGDIQDFLQTCSKDVVVNKKNIYYHLLISETRHLFLPKISKKVSKLKKTSLCGLVIKHT